MSRNNQHGKSVNSESVLRAEVDNVTVVGDVVAAIATALAPIAMFMSPLMGATLLPNHAVFRARSYMPRTLRSMPNHALFWAWMNIPGSLLGMFGSLHLVLLEDTLPATFRLLSGVFFRFARLFTFGSVFVLTLPVALTSAVAIRRSSGSEN